MCLGFVDIRRHGAAHGFLPDFAQKFVAGETAREQPWQMRYSGDVENLPDLLLHLVAFKEDELPDGSAYEQTGISRQQNTAFPERQFDQFVICETVGVQDIQACDAQPFGQTSQHYVGDEAGNC